MLGWSLIVTKWLLHLQILYLHLMQKEDENIGLTHLFLISGKQCFSEPHPPPAQFDVFVSQNWVTDTPESKESWKFRALASSLCSRGRMGRKGIETGTELPSQECLPKQREPKTIPKPYERRILPNLNNYFSMFLAPNSTAIFFSKLCLQSIHLSFHRNVKCYTFI